eukprot:m.1457953 g.1457953  ORF g.1457953 m.1457953 type:complete len:676 (+) comp25121_c0_seq77:232-2259(+)
MLGPLENARSMIVSDVLPNAFDRLGLDAAHAIPQRYLTGAVAPPGHVAQNKVPSSYRRQLQPAVAPQAVLLIQRRGESATEKEGPNFIVNLTRQLHELVQDVSTDDHCQPSGNVVIQHAKCTVTIHKNQRALCISYERARFFADTFGWCPRITASVTKAINALNCSGKSATTSNNTHIERWATGKSPPCALHDLRKGLAAFHLRLLTAVLLSWGRASNERKACVDAISHGAAATSDGLQDDCQRTTVTESCCKNIGVVFYKERRSISTLLLHSLINSISVGHTVKPVTATRMTSIPPALPISSPSADGSEFAAPSSQHGAFVTEQPRCKTTAPLEDIAPGIHLAQALDALSGLVEDHALCRETKSNRHSAIDSEPCEKTPSGHTKKRRKLQDTEAHAASVQVLWLSHLVCGPVRIESQGANLNVQDYLHHVQAQIHRSRTAPGVLPDKRSSQLPADPSEAEMAATSTCERARESDNDYCDVLVNAAVAFHLLGSKLHTSIMEKDITKTNFSGLFVVYNLVRCRHLVKKFHRDRMFAPHVDYAVLTHSLEWQLALLLASFEEKVLQSVELAPHSAPADMDNGRGSCSSNEEQQCDCIRLTPKNFRVNAVVDYLHRLSSLFSKYYGEVRVVDVSKKGADAPRNVRTSTRIHLVESVGAVLDAGLQTLGIHVPASMSM